MNVQNTYNFNFVNSEVERILWYISSFYSDILQPR